MNIAEKYNAINEINAFIFSFFLLFLFKIGTSSVSPGATFIIIYKEDKNTKLYNIKFCIYEKLIYCGINIGNKNIAKEI